jgi:hypothetical protein
MRQVAALLPMQGPLRFAQCDRLPKDARRSHGCAGVQFCLQAVKRDPAVTTDEPLID